MGNLRRSNDVILAKIESVYATDPVPVAASNAVLVQNISFSTEGLRMNARPAVRANIGQLQSVFGGKLGRLSFEVEVKGSGTAGTAPEVGPLLKACGFGQTIATATSVTYKPVSASHDSITLYWFEGGRKKHILTGARGNVSIRCEAGGIAVFVFEFVGHHTAPTDATQPAPTYSSVVPKAALSMAISLGAVTSAIVRSWQVDVNNSLVMPPSVAAADGYGQIQIGQRDVAGQVVMDAELASVIDVDAQFAAGTGITFGSGTLGSVAGNRFTVTGATSGLYWRDVQNGEQDGLVVRTLPFGIVESSSGNDEISLVFT